MQLLDLAENLDDAARTARYLVKMTSYAVKDVNHATGQVSHAADRLLM